MRAYIRDNDFESDPCEPHERVKNDSMDMETLHLLTGIEYIKINPQDFVGGEIRGELEKLITERKYKAKDYLVIGEEAMGEQYEERLRIFAEEHLHGDMEVRMVIEGSGYFDVRDVRDQWIRLLVSAGDFLILPAGIYHRFHQDNAYNYIKLLRLFAEETCWKAYPRELGNTAFKATASVADGMEIRREYVQKLNEDYHKKIPRPEDRLCFATPAMRRQRELGTQKDHDEEQSPRN